MGFLIQRSAILDGPYRYRLQRIIGTGRTAAIIGVNPSKADHKRDDQTIMKLYGFGARLYIGCWSVGNKFAHVATDVDELKDCDDPIGPDNDQHLEQILRDADLHIVAWGTLAKLPPKLRSRWKDVVSIADKVGCPLFSFGISKDGHPKHPLMLPYNTKLSPWSPPRGNASR